MSKKKIVICASGESGIQQRLKDIYENYDEFILFNKMYNITERLSFPSPRKLWEENPIIEGSANPKDLRIVELQNKEKW